MKGMVLKDLYVSKAIVKTYLLMMAGFLLLTVMGLYTASAFSGFFVLLLILIPVNTFAYDEQAGWDKYAAATPAVRKGVVQGKYVYCLLLIAICLVASVLLNTLLFFLGRGGDATLAELVIMGVACVCIGTLINDILIPLVFRYGSQKSRIALMLVTGGGIGAVMLAVGVFHISERTLMMLVMLIPVIALVGFVASYLISLHIYDKKEF